MGKYEWPHNCQRCVPTYELRRRGYNVVAKPSTGIFDRLQIEWNSMYNGFKSIKCSSDKPAQEIVGYLNSIRGNARCEVWCMWSRDEGHVFVAEKIGKDVIFLDPQSNRINCIDYFEKALKGSIEFGRTDNLTFSSIISECCEYIGR